MSEASHEPKVSGSSAVKKQDQEKILNAPDRSTLFMLSAIALLTLIMWGAGRAACNYRVRGEGLQPRALSVRERTTSAKSTAFEWAQAFQAGRFEVVRQLSTAEFQEQLNPLIESQAKGLALDSTCSDCAVDAPQSVARVLKQDEEQAVVKVETWVNEKRLKRTLTLKLGDDKRWKVATALGASPE